MMTLRTVSNDRCLHGPDAVRLLRFRLFQGGAMRAIAQDGEEVARP
jgi:hypothetical protein